MRTPSYSIPYKFGDTIYIKPFFDIHKGSTACDFKAFKNDLSKTDKNTYYLFGGDTFDSIVVTDPRYRKSGDASLSEAIIDENIDEMVDVLSPYSDRIIGMMHGNHEDQIVKRNGTDPIGRLCRRIGCIDMGYSGLLRLRFSEKGARGRTVIIRYHHGWGGGSRTQGADLTKYSKDTTHWQADLFLYGHVHRKQTDKIPRMGLSGDKLISKPKLVCICGTYLRTYTKGKQPTYSEVKGYPPVEIGTLTISIKPVRTWVEMKAHLD
jgi:hypothetical protein